MISEIVDDSCSEAEKEQNSLLNIAKQDFSVILH
jgi:hypothetical protein